MDRAENRSKNSKMKWVVGGSGCGCGCFMVFPLLIVILLVAGVMPSASDSFVADYQAAAAIAGCPWQDLLAYDTVRYKNDLEKANPYISALDFMKVYYEEYRKEKDPDDGTVTWVLEDSGSLETPEAIRSYFHLGADADIQAVSSAISNHTKPKYDISVSDKLLDDVIEEKKFDDDQVEWINMMLGEGILDEMYGDGATELPDYIVSSANGYFGWPTPTLHTVTSPFNPHRLNPVLGVVRAHNGCDISGPNALGAPVVSIDAGTVTQVNMHGGERGIYIRIKHSDGWASLYQHLSAVKVQVGDEVQRGTVIGAVGNTGIGTGAHLHIEITYNGKLLDPFPLIHGEGKSGGEVPPAIKGNRFR